MTTNLRCDDLFVQDEGWYRAKQRYEDFIKENKNKRIVFLELGVGYSTPVWIKYPFMRMTLANPNAAYICIDKGYIYIPDEIKNQTIAIQSDIQDVI